LEGIGGDVDGALAVIPLARLRARRAGERFADMLDLLKAGRHDLQLLAEFFADASTHFAETGGIYRLRMTISSEMGNKCTR